MQLNNFGVMIDCSRNAVMTVDALKQFMTILARMGYNQVHLYMEDTYTVEDEPLFGYLRGRYSPTELKELDDFAFGLGIELVPNIQTLAHITAFNRWRPDIIDTNDILLVGDDKVYDLIDRMFRSLRKCFRTDKIHIGMDEAHMLGRGKYYDQNGDRNRFDILLEHLQKVCDTATQYDFKPMMWSDMFYRIACGGDYYQSNAKFDQSVRALVPSNLTLVYWDYYSSDRKRYDRMIKGHRQLSEGVVFAGGAWKWMGFAPLNSFSIQNTKAALRACEDNGIRDLFLTLWGDNGAECSSFAVLPTLCYAACVVQGIRKQADIYAKFQEWVGVRMQDFLLLDIPNKLQPSEHPINPCKYFLYADCFMSLFQQLEQAKFAADYATFARKLKLAKTKVGEYAYLFDTLAKLCDVLAIKVNICSRTRAAYGQSDRVAMDNVIADYKKMIKRTEAFYRAFREQWFKENKPHGFDVQDIRLGGLLQRMRACLERLIDYREGRVDCIPELEEDIVSFEGPALICDNLWDREITANVLSKT